MPLTFDLEQVQKESRARLHPSLTNPNWLILRRRRQMFEAGLDRLPARALRVLVFLMAFFKPRILAPRWQWTFVPLLNIAGSAVERMAGDNDQFTVNYSVWAHK